MTLDKLKKAIDSGKIKIGTDRTIKALKKGEAKDVFVSSNCPEELVNKIKKYCDLGKIGFNHLKVNNEELGVICKKPFLINMCYSC